MFPKILGIDSYLFMAVIGFAAGILLGWVRRKKYGYKTNDVIFWFCIIVIGLIIGSRILFTLTQLPTLIADGFSAESVKANILNAGFVFYGGMLGALLAVYIVAKKTKSDVRKVLNFVVPTFPCFHIFGRIGCLLDGCCYGVKSSWGITLAGETVKRVPVQLFEAIGLVIITAILLLLESDSLKKEKSFPLTPVYLSLYAVLRFMTEMFRDDLLRGVYIINIKYKAERSVSEWKTAFSTSQLISVIILAVIAVYVWYLLMTRKKTRIGGLETEALTADTEASVDEATDTAEESEKTEEITKTAETSEAEI